MQKKLKYLASGVLALIISVALSSCGNKYENGIERQIDLMNEYSDEFDKDPKSATLKEIQERLDDNEQKMADLGEPSDAKVEKIMEKYKSELEAALPRYLKAQLGSITEEMGSEMGEFGDLLKGISAPE